MELAGFPGSYFSMAGPRRRVGSCGQPVVEGGDVLRGRILDAADGVGVVDGGVADVGDVGVGEAAFIVQREAAFAFALAGRRTETEVKIEAGACGQAHPRAHRRP